jgi:hypothetical protein
MFFSCEGALGEKDRPNSDKINEIKNLFAFHECGEEFFAFL